MESELTLKINDFQEKLRSSQLALKERDDLITQEHLDDFNKNFQNKIQAELHHLHFVQSEDIKRLVRLQEQNQQLVIMLYFCGKRWFSFVLKRDVY